MSLKRLCLRGLGLLGLGAALALSVAAQPVAQDAAPKPTAAALGPNRTVTVAAGAKPGGAVACQSARLW